MTDYDLMTAMRARYGPMIESHFARLCDEIRDVEQRGGDAEIAVPNDWGRDVDDAMVLGLPVVRADVTQPTARIRGYRPGRLTLSDLNGHTVYERALTDEEVASRRITMPLLDGWTHSTIEWPRT